MIRQPLPQKCLGCGISGYFLPQNGQNFLFGRFACPIFSNHRRQNGGFSYSNFRGFAKIELENLKLFHI